MRREFYDIYRDLYDLYRRDFSILEDEQFFFPRPPFTFPPTRTLRWVTEAVEEAIGELKLSRRLRPDGKHFLLVNLHQMVVLPLVRSESAKAHLPELQSDLRSDAQTILEAAVEDSTQNNEISGTAVLMATSRVWKQLRVSRLEIWG